MAETTQPLGNLPPEQMMAHSGVSSSSAAFTFGPVSSDMSSVGRSISAYTYCSMGLREVRDYTQHLCGRIKTIVDAAVSDPRQNKAVKDLIHDAFWTEHYDAVRKWCERHVNDLNADDPMHPNGAVQSPFPFWSDTPLPSD